MLYNSDNELFKLIKEKLYTAVVGDILDQMGFLNQFLPPQIRPASDDMKIAGRAMTVLEADCHEHLSSGEGADILKKPFGLMLEALDDLKENEVYLCSGSSFDYALWGELMATRAMVCKSAGAVVNGYSRDTEGILKIGLPLFSRGFYAQDQSPRGKVIDWRVQLKVGNVMVNPGDIVIGDIDGVVIIPKSIENEVIKRAYEKATGEKRVQKEIAKGMSAKDAFDKYGIM